jgi:hypothetical protein
MIPASEFVECQLLGLFVFCLVSGPTLTTIIEMRFRSPVITLVLRLWFFIWPSNAQSNYWVANIPRQGQSAFSPNASTYQIYRNVMNFGAKGPWRRIKQLIRAR